MRLCASPVFGGRSPREVRRWSFADALDAHAVLDMMDALAELDRAKVPAPPPGTTLAGGEV